MSKYVKLFAPKEYGNQPCSYHDATEAMIKEHTGGCGPGGFGDFLVPDNLWGLSVFKACQIHDWMYAFGLTLADKELADRIFLNNMIRIIKSAKSNKLMVRIRLRRAKTYYYFVKTFGADAFWSGKNESEEVKSVLIDS